MNTHVWLIEPRDPFFSRDGRPFGGDPGARATSLPFPYPPTTTGSLRTLSCLDAEGRFELGEKTLKSLLEMKVGGPLLLELDQNGDVTQHLAPAPADALLSSVSNADSGTSEAPKVEHTLHWQRPILPPSGAETDLDTHCKLVGVPTSLRGKPARGPAWWNQAKFEEWLLNPEAVDGNPCQPAELGTDGPTREMRTHVALDSDSGTAREGMLFQTRSLEFSRRDHAGGFGQRRLSLAAWTNEPIQPRYFTVGGERRISAIRPAETNGGKAFHLPACGAELAKRICSDRACRIILLTPALFDDGWSPKWLLGDRNDCKPSLEGAIVSRTQVVSGWDFAAPRGGRPKVARRMVPSGSVFYLTLNGSASQIVAWINETWMMPVSDQSQDRTDGFGLAVLGAWSGKREEQR